MFSPFAKHRIIAPAGYNRWLVPPASIAIHLCIGSVYAWSNFNGPLTKVRGVLASAPDDWTLSQVVWIFTVAIVVLGLSAAFAGKWLEQVGPRAVGTVAAVCWGGGFLVGSLGIWLHQLWLLYLGYGVIGGCGLGLGYVSPVSTLLKWFPDRRGMATGLAIMGFGGGAIIGAPLIDRLVDAFQRLRSISGSRESVDPQLRTGAISPARTVDERPGHRPLRKRGGRASRVRPVPASISSGRAAPAWPKPLSSSAWAIFWSCLRPHSPIASPRPIGCPPAGRRPTIRPRPRA